MNEDIVILPSTDSVDAATESAERATEQANIAAAMAMSASAAQSQLVGQVMQAGREDAQKAAIEAEVASIEAQEAANDAVATNVAVLAQVQRLHDRIIDEIAILRAEMASSKSPEPSGDEEEQVTEIHPDGPKEDDESNVPTSNRRKKKVGRRK